MASGQFLYGINALAQTSETTRYQNELLYLQSINTAPLPSSALQSNIIIAVIDEGVQFNHPELLNNYWINKQETANNGMDDDQNGFIDDARGWNFLHNNNNIAPQGTHATEVAGIIKAVAAASGITDDHLKIMSLVACTQAEGCDMEAISRGIKYAADNGANVINLSLGTARGYAAEFDDVIRYAYNKGAVIVAAAGNGNSEGEGKNLDFAPVSPACNDNGANMILGVSGVSQSGNIVPWSNFGSCVDVVAPMTNIYTIADPAWNNGQAYGYDQGTSLSAAQVSGLAGAIKSYSPALSNKEITNLIMANSDMRADYNNLFNAGKINAYNSLRSLAVSYNLEIPMASNNVLGATAPKQRKKPAAKPKSATKKIKYSPVLPPLKPRM